MRVDDRADAVLELRNHLAAAVVGGRVGREQDQHVDVEVDRIAANLHVALFQDVEQADLHQLVELGQFVDGEDAAVHARNQPEVQGLFGRHAGAAGQLGRIDLADDVGELGARRQPLGIAGRARPPGDRHFFFGHAGHQFLADPRDRVVRIVVQRGLGHVDVGNLVVEKPHQRPHQPALGLPLFAQEQHVVLGDQGQVDFRNHGVFVADDAGKQLVALAEHAR